MSENKFKKDYSVGDLTDIIINSESKYETFIKVKTYQKGLVFLNLPNVIQIEFAKIMRISRIIKIIKYLDTDDTLEFLQHFSKKKQKRILAELDKSQKNNYEYLLNFDSETAAGLMNIDYILITPKIEIEKLRDKIRRLILKNNQTPLILVKNFNGKLLGHIPISKLILEQEYKIEEYVEPIPTVYFDEDYEEVIEVIKEENADEIVVLDSEDSVIGYIDSTHLLRVAEKKNQEELYKFAGVKNDEDILDDAKYKIKSRWLWLLINLFTAFLAAGVIGLFEDTLSKFVLLAVYLPIIAGMGGNAATQTLAVVIRGIVLHEIDLKGRLKIIKEEVLAALTNGLITGIVVAIIAYLYNGLFMLGVIVFLSMIVNLIIAAFFGTIVPFILKKFDIDPAIAATVFVTTATDIFGFLTFLGLAELLLF